MEDLIKVKISITKLLFLTIAQYATSSELYTEILIPSWILCAGEPLGGVKLCDV